MIAASEIDSHRYAVTGGEIALVNLENARCPILGSIRAGSDAVGPLLTDQQRWALVEYLKSIPKEGGRVTPFGGPPNARGGNQPWANTK
jgi:hypothetical protein